MNAVQSLDEGATRAVPPLAIVICTRNRAAQLERCLANLTRLPSSSPWELVLVDNGSTDVTSSIIDRFMANSAVPIVRCFAPIAGLGRARNVGWRAARGDIVAFTDDDCYPESGFVQAVLSIFDSDRSIGFVGGRIALYDQSDYPITIQEYPQRVRLPAYSCIPAGLIQAANLSVRRRAIESVGGFDERLGAGTRFPCEDIDLVARLSGSGWAGVYDPQPLVYHHHGRKTEAEASQLMRQYDRGRGAYYAKCLANPAIFRSTVRHWGRQMLRQPLRTTMREWLAAGEYGLRVCGALSVRGLQLLTQPLAGPK